MSDDIKPEVIKKTQDILGKLIKKPQLTEKLLRKPPFRFLHDIVTNIIKETGFLKGLFSEEELNHENIKDRDGKIAFLDKLINCVKLATGAALNVKSTKIVAGLEPARTNELLQAIGTGVNSKTDTSKAVQDILKKSSKKGSGPEVKKKEKPSEPGSTATKQENTKREKRDSTGTVETRKADRKDPASSGRGPQKVPDKRSEKQDGPGETKKRSSSNQKATKDPQKPTAKPVKIARDDSGEKPIEKVSIDLKDESALMSEDAVTIDEPGKDQDQGGNLENTPIQSTEDRLPAPEAALSAPEATPQPDEEKEQSTAIDKESTQIDKHSAERQRPVSALGRKRSSATTQLKQQSNIDEPPEQAEVPSTITLTNNGDSLADKKEKEKQDINGTIPQIPSSRPPSAMPGPSRVNSEQQPVNGATPVPLVRPRTAARVGSARPGAPRLRNRGEVALVSEEQVKPSAVNLIVDADGVKEDQDEDENLVVLENPTTSIVADNDITRPGSEVMRPPSQQGQLVAQILETQKELEGSKVLGQNTTQTENSSHKVEINWEASRQRERGAALKEVQRLCESIQTVTRAAHPIGKLLDTLQEDVDSMQQELEQWQNLQRTLEEQLLAEEALTIQSTQPLKEHLQQLQQAVHAEHDQLSASKANILANDQRIQKLLAGGDMMKQTVF